MVAKSVDSVARWPGFESVLLLPSCVMSLCLSHLICETVVMVRLTSQVVVRIKRTSMRGTGSWGWLRVNYLQVFTGLVPVGTRSWVSDCLTPHLELLYMFPQFSSITIFVSSWASLCLSLTHAHLFYLQSEYVGLLISFWTWPSHITTMELWGHTVLG